MHVCPRDGDIKSKKFKCLILFVTSCKDTISGFKKDETLCRLMTAFNYHFKNTFENHLLYFLWITSLYNYWRLSQLKNSILKGRALKLSKTKSSKLSISEIQWTWDLHDDDWRSSFCKISLLKMFPGFNYQSYGNRVNSIHESTILVLAIYTFNPCL